MKQVAISLLASLIGVSFVFGAVVSCTTNTSHSIKENKSELKICDQRTDAELDPAAGCE